MPVPAGPAGRGRYGMLGFTERYQDRVAVLAAPFQTRHIHPRARPAASRNPFNAEEPENTRP